MEHEAFSAAFTGVTKLFLIVETNLLLVIVAALSWSKHLAGESNSVRWRGSVLRSAAGSDLKLGNCLTSAPGPTTTSCSRLIPSCSNVVSVSMLPGLEGREDREK